MSRLPLSLTPTQILFVQRFVVPAIIGLLVLVSLLALVRTALKSGEWVGSYDLQAYWYYGHFIRAGVNPYIAYAEDFTLDEIGKTLQYVDGSVVAPDAEDHPRLGRVPANTAPILILLSLLAYFPWAQAKTIWILCNLAFILAIPWLVMRLLPPQLQLPSSMQWLAAFSFYAIKGSREGAATGQTSLVVFFLMVVTLLLRRSHWFWAGLALGVALSKYSMSLPIFIFLLLEKRFRLLAVAVSVQVVGLVAVAALENASLYNSFGESLVATFMVNWGMVAQHSTELGIHFGYVLRAFPQLAMLLTIVVILGTVIGVGYTWRRGWLASDLLPVNTLMVLGILLVVYHRHYDTLMSIMFFVLALSVIAHWQLPTRQNVILGILYLLVVVVLALPSDIQRSFLTEAQAETYMVWRDGIVTAMVTAMWVVNLYLLPCTPRVSDSRL
jgi:hypothetical protein